MNKARRVSRAYGATCYPIRRKNGEQMIKKMVRRAAIKVERMEKLQAMTRDQLRNEAKMREIQGRSKMTKEELIAALAG